MTQTHPSKALKFCPFCGSSRFTWDGLKAHHCQDCKHRLYTNEVGAVIALIQNDKKEFLFTIRKHNPAKGKLDLPGVRPPNMPSCVKLKKNSILRLHI